MNTDQGQDTFHALLADVPGVSTEISPDDGMFAGNEEHYFSVGQSALRSIKIALLSATVDPSAVSNVLDFACGHGRVLRGLRAMLPTASITACDSLRRGVDFCSEKFEANGVYSHPNLTAVELGENFDLIWCGSLLTHLHMEQWYRLIELLCDVLAPNGVVVLTFHGQRVIDRFSEGSHYGLDETRAARLLSSVRDGGFGYENYGGQEGYGISVSTPSWVLRYVGERFPLLRVVHLKEHAWDDHQDVVAFQKRSIG